MGSNTQFIYFSQECRDKSPHSCSKKKEPEGRNFDSRRVTKSILHEILGEMHKVNHEKPIRPCKVIKIARETPRHTHKQKKDIPLNNACSMTGLIIWNISKAIQMRPCVDLKESIKVAEQRLNSDAHICALGDQDPEQQHLLCALLAWHQMGHHHADSLYKFVKPKIDEKSCCASKCESKPNSNRNSVIWKKMTPADNGSFGSHTAGPVVSLPVETRVLMRVDNAPGPCSGSTSPCSQRTTLPPKTRLAQDEITNDKLDATFDLSSPCAEMLATLEEKISELRVRACQLAQQEGTRVKLLERAEGAWADLEKGYQKKIDGEKETLRKLESKIKNMMVERKACKATCKSKTAAVAERKKDLEALKKKLTEIENKVYALATKKLQASEEAARSEAALAEELAMVMQYERDLKIDEDQTRRKFDSLMNESDSARALACETERAMRAELAALRDQIERISKQLHEQDEKIMKHRTDHEQLRTEKKDLIEDLESCKSLCDKKMQSILDELKNKKKKLLDLQEQVLECRCKVPIEAGVQVKRTSSLVAMCRCAPEDNLLESCSCTSLRSKLLTNLLADLFDGLQAELGSAGSQMPCQMLKCLEDKHSWDRPSVIKTNLRNYFSKLLRKELDIAIATSIESYHARWVGNSCADAPKIVPTLEDDLKEGWQQRAIERRAQQLANKLAGDLINKKTDKQRGGKETRSCECSESSTKKLGDKTALFPCLMPLNSAFHRATTTTTVYRQAGETPPPYWDKAIEDVTQLKLQIEDLKKDAIKKEDLKVMEENIFKIVREGSVLENENPLATTTRDTSNFNGESVKKEIVNSRVESRDHSPKTSNQNKFGTNKKKDSKGFLNKKGSVNEKPTKQSKKLVHGQTYAVNLCLGGPQKNTKSLQNAQLNNSERSTWKPNSLKHIMPQTSTVKQIKPINIDLPSPELRAELCDSNCKCFHKAPSNASINRLLQTLATWKYELTPQEKSIESVKESSSKCSKSEIKQILSNLKQNDSIEVESIIKKPVDNIEVESIIKKPVGDSDINNATHSTKADQQNQSHIKPPITTESEYMGTVYLDKSHENICKCVANIESNKENNYEKYDNSEEKIPFQCINTHTCDCKLYKKMQKDHKRTQTVELNLPVQSNQHQDARSKDYPEFAEFQHNPKSNSHINGQKETNQISNMNNVPLKTELYTKNSEYFIKFLGVTLDDLSSDKIKKIEPAEQQKKFSKKLTNIDKSNSLIKQIGLTKEKNNQSRFNDCTKYECKAKFKEYTTLMTNILDNNLHENSHKDEVIDPQNVKCAPDNTLGSCVCCNGVHVGDSKDLEVNAFHLLEEHIKEKMKEFKRFSSIPPEEEENIFSTILQRVKQVISDCANKMKCGSPGELPNNGSWNRAYGLLQEYLKLKIKRVQCLCVFNDRKDVILPEVLDKVCNLIESDFKRLEDICTCKNNTGVRTNIVRVRDLVITPPTELPEKDTNTSQAKYNDSEIKKGSVTSKLSKQNSNNSMVIKENISSQVSSYLGMEAKSCDAMEPSSYANARTTETDHIITHSKSNGVMYNTCDCCDNTDKVDILSFPDMFGTKEVFVNLYTEQAVNTNDICDFSLVTTDQGTSRCLLAGGESTKPISKIENNKNYEKILVTQKRITSTETPQAPYIGYTVNCSCDGALGSCFCMKSVVQSDNNKIDSLWKGLLVNNNKQFSYIMHGVPNQNNSDVDSHTSPNDELVEEASTTAIINDDVHTCEAEIIAENVDDVVLKCSLENVDLTQHASTTADVESSSLETGYSNSEFFPVDWIKSPLPVVPGRSHAIKLTNSIYFPGIPIDNDEISFISGTTTDFDTQKNSECCACDKVPICHVKMLVEHIEKNLVECKCTCDSLISKVCPIHSKRDF